MSMTKSELAAYIKELREGLEGVTPGRWDADGDFVRDRVGLRVAHCYADWKTDILVNNDAAHIARCSPDRIAALLDHVEELTKELGELAELSSAFLPLADEGSRLHVAVERARALKA